MNNNIKYSFSIRDLENFSGIKAHTIRMWERRYNLLTPERTEGNQRTYDLTNLQKLLNVKLLYEHGHKISKIAAYDSEEIPKMVVDIITRTEESTQAIDSFKLAMLNFDQSIFERTYIKLISNISFRRVFIDVFIPLLEQIGYLWQADSITPAHEHFICNLIQQKLLANIERVQVIQHHKQERVYVLYLPDGEIHDLGLLFLHYELTLRGCKSIYLGQSVPMDNLFDLMNIHETLTFVSYFTISPRPERLDDYVKRLNEELLVRENDSFWALGRRTTDIDMEGLQENFQILGNIEAAIAKIDH